MQDPGITSFREPTMHLISTPHAAMSLDLAAMVGRVASQMSADTTEWDCFPLERPVENTGQHITAARAPDTWEFQLLSSRDWVSLGSAKVTFPLLGSRILQVGGLIKGG